MASFDYDTLPVNPAEKGKPYRQPLKGQLALAGFKNLTPFNEKAKEVDSATTKGKQSRKGKGEDAENDEDSDIEMGEDGSVAPEDEDGHQEHFPARASSAIAAKTKRKRTEDATTTASKRLQTAPAHLRAGTEPLQQLRQPQAAPKSLMVALKCGDRLRDTLARVGRSSTMAPALNAGPAIHHTALDQSQTVTQTSEVTGPRADTNTTEENSHARYKACVDPNAVGNIAEIMQGAQIKSAVDQTHQNGTPHTPLLSSSSKQAHAKKTAIPEKNTSLNVTPILRSGLLNKPRLSYDDRSLVQRSEMLALTPNASNISGTSNKEEDEHLDGERQHDEVAVNLTALVREHIRLLEAGDQEALTKFEENRGKSATTQERRAMGKALADDQAILEDFLYYQVAAHRRLRLRALEEGSKGKT
ncbi:hypothetical protein PtrV1_02023 [Pyrenophora tritici-repentis]|nr:hypothetical protein PtrV1_02023 [Pyrenophora tritici-repentis]